MSNPKAGPCSICNQSTYSMSLQKKKKRERNQCIFYIFNRFFHLFFFSFLCLWHNFFIFPLDEMQKYVRARAGEDKLEPWSYSFSCWGEKESSVSLADNPLNLIHYCVVTLLSPHARKWASCGALKPLHRGQFQPTQCNKIWIKLELGIFFQSQLELQIASATISHCIC